jgi:serine/threonine protein kinase
MRRPSGSAPVLVDHAAQQTSLVDSRVERDHYARIAVGRVLLQALMRPMLGRHVGLDRDVAIKVPLIADDDQLKSFRAEARILAKIGSHPHVVHIYDLVEDLTSCAIIMEYLPGWDVG